MVRGLADNGHVERPIASCRAAVAEFGDLEVVAIRTGFDGCGGGKGDNASAKDD